MKAFFLLLFLLLFLHQGCSSETGIKDTYDDDAFKQFHETFDFQEATDDSSKNDALNLEGVHAPDSGDFETSEENFDVETTEKKDLVNETSDVSTVLPITWKQIVLGEDNEYVFKAIWGSDPANIFVAGVAGKVLKIENDHPFFVFSDESLKILNSIWGSSASDIWAVGMYGSMVHFDGNKWNLPGSCKSDNDCPVPDACYEPECVDGVCSYSPTFEAGCCETDFFVKNFDDLTLQGFTVEDIYEGTDNGGIVWNVAAINSYDGNPRYISPPASLYFGIPDKKCGFDETKNCPDFSNGKTVGSIATSEEVTVPTGKKATLSFYVFLDVESSDNFDIFKVNIIDEEGNASTIVDKSECGNGKKSFVKITKDISKFMGKKIKVQFYFDSVDSAANGTEGVYIDDVKIDVECGIDSANMSNLPTLWGVWGNAPDNFYAVGDKGVVVKYDGKSWKIVNDASSISDLMTISGSKSKGDLIIGGTKGKVILKKNGAYDNLKTDPPFDINGMWINETGDFAVLVGKNGTLFEYENGKFTKIETALAYTLYSVYGKSKNDYYVVGGGGVVLHRNNGSNEITYPASGLDLKKVFINEAGVFACGSGGKVVVNFDGTWKDSSLQTSPPPDLNSIWAHKTELMIVVGKQGAVAVKDGPSWKNLNPGVTATLTDVYGFSKNNIYITGLMGTLLHYDGEKFEKIDLGYMFDLYGIWGVAPDDIYVIGQTGAIFHFNGDKWELEKFDPVSDLRGIWGINSENIYAFGKGALIYKYNGNSWKLMKVAPIKNNDGNEVPITDTIYALWGSSPDKLWAVGASGRLLYFDGEQWEAYSSGTEKTLRAIYGTSEDNIFAVGHSGAIIHYEKGEWKIENGNTIANLYSVFALDEKNIYCVGDRETILKRITK